MADFAATFRATSSSDQGLLGYPNGRIYNPVLFVKLRGSKWYLDFDANHFFYQGATLSGAELLAAGGGGGGGGGGTIGLIAISGEKGILVDLTDPKRPVVSPDLIAGNGTTLTDPAVTHGDKLANAGQIAEAMKLILQEMGQYATLAEIQQSFYTKGETYTQEDVNNFVDQIVAELTTNYYNRLQADQAAGELIIEAIKDLVRTADKASPTDLANGVADKWLDAQLMRARLGELAQYVEDKFSIPAGAEVGWVYTLRTIRSQGGAAETTYGWEPLPAGTGTGGTGGLTTTQVNQLIGTALQGYAKLIDGKQIIIADDINVDILRFSGDGNDPNSYQWAVAVRQSFQTGRDHLMVANATDLQDGSPLLNQQDGFDLLRVVQSWFTAANLPTPVIPSYAVRGVAEALRQVAPPGNKMAPAQLEQALLSAIGSDAGATLAPAELERLKALVSAPAWDGSDASLTAALPELEAILAAGRLVPADPFVHRSELTGGSSANAVEAIKLIPQLRLRAVGPQPLPTAATPVALPSQTWTRLPATFPTEIVGTWEAQEGRVTVPADGQYELYVQCLTSLAADAPPAELLVRVIGPAGIYSGDSGSTTTLGAVLEHSSVIAAQGGDQLAVEVYTEANGVRIHPQTLVWRLALSGTTVRREVWVEPPAPWGLPAAADPANTPTVRRIVLGVPSGPLPSAAPGLWRIEPTVTAEGGAVAALGAKGSATGLPVDIGSQVGRLFRVSGRIAGATAAQLALVSNGASAVDLQGPCPTRTLAGNPELPRFPNGVNAGITSTRADFATGTWGNFYDPQLLYISSAAAQLELKLLGGNSSGGQVILTDVTPGNGDYIGVDLVADKTFTQASPSGFWGMDLAAIRGADGLWTPDNPAFVPTGKSDGYGHRFYLNHLPNGIYRVQAEFTVTGEHIRAGWRPGWNCNTHVKDQFMPSRRTFNADGSVTYVIDTVYRLGTADGSTGVGYWFGITPTATSIGKPISVKGWTKLRRLPQGTSNFTVELPFVSGQELNTYGAALKYDVNGQTRTGPGLLTHNANNTTSTDDPYLTGDVSWSGYGSSNPVGPELASIHGLFMQVSQATTNGCRWDAKMSLLVDGAINAAEVIQRRVGANHVASNVVNQGKQADGNFLYTVELLDVRGIDGKWWENFILGSARATTAGTKLVKGGITLSGTFNQFPII